MTSLTRTTALRRTLLQSPRKSTPLALQNRFASSDYGSGKGSPVGEKPQDQGANPSADKEHPGPPPPKAGEGSGGGPTKGTAEGHSSPNQPGGQNSGKRSFSTMRTVRAFSTMRSLKAKDRPKSTEGLSPKILNESPPKDHEASEDVKKHNRELEGRKDRAHEGVSNEDAVKDKVSSKFWSGQGGTEGEGEEKKT